MRLLERAQARHDLAASLEVLPQGTGSVVLVLGEAGIGKTSLVREFVDDVGGRARVLIGGCDDLAVPRPLGPLLELAEAVPELARRLTEGDAARVMAEALRGQPTVCVVEDVHWADEATLDVLTFLARRVDQWPVLLVLSFRDDEVAADHLLHRTLAAVPTGAACRLRLRPLSEEAVRRMADPGVDAAEVHAVTGGNPFFVTEALASGLDRTPPNVRDAVLGRLAHLEPAARRTAELVSVVPGRAEEWLVAACLGDDADVAACEARGLLLVEGSTVRYRHELARRAVEESVSAARSRGLHRMVLRGLTARGAVSARLAHHAWMAGDADLVVRYGLVVGRQAARAGSHREAADLLSRVMQHEDLLPAPDRADAFDLLSTEAYAAGWTGSAVAAREEALVLRRGLGEPRRTSETLRSLSRVRWWSGDWRGAHDAGTEALEVVRQLPSCREQAMALSNLSQLAMLSQSGDGGIALARQAADIARAVGDLETVLHAQVNHGAALARLDVQAGVAMLEAAAASGAAAGFDDTACRALANAAWMLADSRQYAAAQSVVDRALALAQEKERTVYILYTRAIRAVLALAAGDLAAAVTEVEHNAWDHRRGGQLRPDQLPALQALALVALRRGQPQATAMLEQGWQVAVGSAELQRLRPMACARAEAAWLRRDWRAVDDATATTFALALERGHEWDVGELAVWRARADLLHQPPERCAEPYALEIAGDHLAAAARWERIGAPYEQALALLGSWDAQAIERSIVLRDQMNATSALSIARARLREIGVRSVPRGRRASTRRNPAGLTDRQLEVHRLLIDGLSNREIAERLVLSPKTVEHHVSAVLHKLGVTSRSAAASATRRTDRKVSR